MLIGRGAHARFRAWSNNDAFGDKEFDDEAKCAAERAKFLYIIAHASRPVMPALVQPWPARRTIAMQRMHMSLEHAIAHRVLSDAVLQHVVYRVTDLLLDLSDRRQLHMDAHVGNILLRFASVAHNGMPIVRLNDPGFFFAFGDDGNEKMPDHVRRCAFDPLYDLAFFTYSLLGMLRSRQYARMPITPLSERELTPYQQYIGPPHHWDMAVGRFAYRPELVSEIERSAATHTRAKRARIAPDRPIE